MRKETRLSYYLGSLVIAVWLGLCAFGVSTGMSAEIQTIDVGKTVEKVYLVGENRYLAGVLRGGRTVVIIDAEELEEITRLDVPGADLVFSRSGQLFIAKESSGLVRVYSEKNWELVNEIDTGIKSLKRITARRGEKFDGKILASSYTRVNLVDVKKDTFKTLQEGVGGAQFSVDGEKVIDKKKSDFRVFSAKSYLDGSATKPLALCDSGNIGDLPELITDEFWLSSSNQICVGIPPYHMITLNASSIIPDSDPASKIVYMITQNGKAIEIRQLDDFFSLVQTIKIPPSKIRISEKLYRGMKCARRNTDGSVSLFWTGHFQNGIAMLTFSYSQPLREGSVGVQRIALPEADENVLVSGPDGTEITDTGELVWKPASGVKAGSQSFKVKQTKGGKISFFRKTLEVLPAEEKRLPEGLTKLKAIPGRFPNVVSDTGFGRFAIVDGKRLLVFGEKGTLARTLPLAKGYRSVLCLKSGFALGSAQNIDLIDGEGKVKRTFDLKELELLKMALDPLSGLVYLACKDPTIQDLAKSLPIYKLDLVSGELEKIPRMFGGDVRINPSGDQIVSFISNSQIHWLGISNYYEETTDLLMSYQLDGYSARLHRAFLDPLQGISDVTFSHDGTSMAVKARKVPSRGQLVRGLLPIFETSDLEKPKRVIPFNNSDILAVKYHPKLDLLFVITSFDQGRQAGRMLIVFDGEGRVRKDLFTEESPFPGSADFVAFSPDSESLIVRGQDFYGRKVLQRMPLLLTEEERKIIGEEAKIVPVFGAAQVAGIGDEESLLNRPSAGSKGGLSPLQLKGITRDSLRMKELDPKMMARFMMPSVVIVNGGDNGIGAGFFVSTDGHIVTAAHCLPDLGGPEVYHYAKLPFEKVEFRSQATVIDVDEERDLALIKIDCNTTSPALKLAAADPMVGAKALAIGHPGVENLSLNYTLTSGIVSSEARELEGQKLLQISAPVNPGNSGGPVLDDRGNVIGMVSQKAALEGASFAVPATLIADFLRRSGSEVEPMPAETEKFKKEIESKGWVSIDKFTFMGEKMRATYKGAKDDWFSGTLVVVGKPLDRTFIKLEYKDGWPDGDCVQYDRAGATVKTTRYEKGIKNGPMTTFYPSGNPQLEINLRGGRSNGFSRRFADRKHGVLEASCFKDGVLHGISYRMDELGRIYQKTFFEDGKAVQQKKHYHQDQVEGNLLFEFVEAGDTPMVKRLVESGVSLEKQDKGRGILHAAVSTKMHYVVRDILALGVDLNTTNAKGVTPLAMAMAEATPDLELAKILIDGGASKEGLSESQLKKLE